jgi:hypothetical protein
MAKSRHFHYFILNKEADISSETMVTTCHITRCHMLEDREAFTTTGVKTTRFTNQMPALLCVCPGVCGLVKNSSIGNSWLQGVASAVK